MITLSQNSPIFLPTKTKETLTNMNNRLRRHIVQQLVHVLRISRVQFRSGNLQVELLEGGTVLPAIKVRENELEKV